MDCGRVSYGPRCPAHARAQARRHNAARKARTIGDNAAARLRRSFTGDEACSICGRYNVVLKVDHRIALWRGGLDVDANVWWLCVPCHRAKTAREAALRAKLRRKNR
ncbi:MAG: HNH endonuclease [Gammaproteobacteria bacterium]